MAQARAGCQGCRHYPRAGPASLLLAPGNLTFCSEPTLGGCPKTEDERLGLGPRPCILQGRPSVIPQLCSSAPALQGRLVMSRDGKGPWHGHFLPLLTSQHTPGCELCPTLPPCLLLCTPQPGGSLLTHWVLTWGNPDGPSLSPARTQSLRAGGPISQGSLWWERQWLSQHFTPNSGKPGM